MFKNIDFAFLIAELNRLCVPNLRIPFFSQHNNKNYEQNGYYNQRRDGRKQKCIERVWSCSLKRNNGKKANKQSKTEEQKHKKLLFLFGFDRTLWSLPRVFSCVVLWQLSKLITKKIVGISNYLKLWLSVCNIALSYLDISESFPSRISFLSEEKLDSASSQQTDSKTTGIR